MILIDTHTHLYLDAFDTDRAEIIERSVQAGVKVMLLPDIDSNTRWQMIDVAQNYSSVCKFMLGLHPTSVKNNYTEELDKLKKSLTEYNCCAIGECGLDYYWDKTYIQQQKEVLVQQFYFAHHYQLPLVIHSRKSLEDIISLLKSHKNLNLTGVFHCYPGGINEAKLLIDMGFYIGVGGVVTYKNSMLAEVVKYIPIESILLETDSPFLSPVPFRGKRNESSYITFIAKKIAEIKNMSIESVANITTREAVKLFKLPFYE
ncbi:MAG: TatD family hydrolase [Bacteroidales bacterium]|nr:TatD family hydrolase [Bacteroidales bacterium]